MHLSINDHHRLAEASTAAGPNDLTCCVKHSKSRMHIAESENAQKAASSAGSLASRVVSEFRAGPPWFDNEGTWPCERWVIQGIEESELI